jgi:hypothetical protein
MMTVLPMLACGPSFTLTDFLMVPIVDLWLVGFLAAFTNQFFICAQYKRPRFVFANIGIFVAYVVVGAEVLCGALPAGSRILTVSAYLVPLMAMGHLVFLLFARAREQRA